MENLKDIKDIVDVPEYSLFILIGVVIIGLMVLSVAIYFFKNRRRRRKKPTVKELALKELNSIDYSNTKEVVYGFEEYARVFIDEKNQEDFENIKKELEIYKYKKDIPQLDSKVEEKIKAFIKGFK